MRNLRNLTITVDEAVARWARIWAARHHMSVSKLVGRMLEERMREEEGYDAAMREYLSVKPSRLRSAGKYPGREDLHDRRSLR